MSMITGVGDEVVEVLVLLLVLSVAALAWWSTAARPDRFRTVIVMERTSRNLTLVGTNISNARHRFVRNIIQALPAQQRLDNTDWQEAESIAESTAAEPASAATAGGAEAATSSDQAREMDSIVDAMDADVSAIERRAPSSAKPDGDGPVPSNTISDASKRQESSTGASETNTRTESEPNGQSAVQSDGSDSNKIYIKLKYLNDTFREVDGNLHELVKDFKGRHFASELSAQYRVLLIFNGHVLAQDSSLAACGLYNNCVVHCLVHPPRQTPRSPVGGDVVPSLLGAPAQAGPPPPETTPPAGAPPAPAAARVWDLETVLMTLVSLVLTVIWFFRCEYSNIFTASASGALFALTIFYSIAIFGLYFSDTFHLTDRRAREHAA